jgi:hypothetical protein
MKELLGICVRENKRFTDELFLELVQKYLREDINPPSRFQQYD